MKSIIEKARNTAYLLCKEDAPLFVETFCHIEDKDAPGVIVPFRLWPRQRETLLGIDQNRLNIILKARQLGLSWLVLCYAVWKMLMSPGYSVIALSRTEEEAKELVRRVGVILGNMPELILPAGSKAEGVPLFSMSSLAVSVAFPDGVGSTFKALSSSPAAGRSFTANLILLDEWAFQQWAREIWTAVYPTINRPTGGKVIGLSTIERGTLFEELYNGDFGFYKVFLPWDTDPRRTPDWYEATRKALGDKVLQEYPASVEEAMTIPGGAFFPELREHIHLVLYREIPAEWRRYVSLDYGLDALAALWYAVDESGNAVVYRELYQPDLIISEAAAAILKAGQGESIYAFLAPPDLWNRSQDTGLSKAEVFGRCGMPLTKTSNDREAGWLDVKEWLKPGETRDEITGDVVTRAKLRMMRGCTPELWRCLLNIQKDKRNPRDAAKEPHELTHLPDSLRAFCAGRPRAQEMAKVKRKADFAFIQKETAFGAGLEADRSFIEFGG